MNHYEKFSKALLELSVSKDYEEATNEWDIYNLYTGETVCLCSKKIKNQFEIINKHNQNKSIVGSVCIMKFMAKNEEMQQTLKRRIYNEKQKKLDSSKRKCSGCMQTFMIGEDQYDKCDGCLIKWFKGLSAENKANTLKTVADELRVRIERLCPPPKQVEKSANLVEFYCHIHQFTIYISKQYYETKPHYCPSCNYEDIKKSRAQEIKQREMRDKMEFSSPIPVGLTLINKYKSYELNHNIYFKYVDGGAEVLRIFKAQTNIKYDTEKELHYFRSDDLSGLSYISIRNITPHKFVKDIFAK